MSGDDLFWLVWILVALMLPASSLLSRRAEWPRLARHAAIWVAIFLAGALMVRWLAPAT